MGVTAVGDMEGIAIRHHVACSLLDTADHCKGISQIVHIKPARSLGFWRNTVYLLIAKSFGVKTVIASSRSDEKFFTGRKPILRRFLISKALDAADVNIVLSKRLKSVVSLSPAGRLSISIMRLMRGI